MLDRKLILRVLLISLGVAAVLGATAVMVGAGEVIWQGVLSASLTAIASLAMLTLTRENKLRQNELTISTVGVVLVFILIMLSIWFPRFGSGYNWSYEVRAGFFATALIMGGICSLVVGCVRMLRSGLTLVTGWIGLCLLAVTTPMFLLGMWVEIVTDVDWSGELMMTALSLALAGAVAGVAMVGWSSPDKRMWRWVSVIATAVSFVIALVGIWTNSDSDPTLFVIVTSIAIVVAHMNLMLVLPVNPAFNWLRWCTIAAGVVTALLLDALVYLDPQGMGGSQTEQLGRLTGAGAIFTAFGTLAMFVLAGIHRAALTTVRPEASAVAAGKVSLTCPRCSTNQSLPTGDSNCTGCGLRIHIRIEEPVCTACGYQLYMLTANKCPECGSPLPLDVSRALKFV